jgi:hypothetical protein
MFYALLRSHCWVISVLFTLFVEVKSVLVEEPADIKAVGALNRQKDHLLRLHLQTVQALLKTA